MLAVFWSAKGRVAIYSKTEGGSSQGAPVFGKMLELAPIQSKTNPTTLGHIEILRHTEDDVVLQVAFEGLQEVSAVLAFGTSEIIDVKPSAAMNGISLLGSFEYGIVPSFIGDDLIFGSGNGKFGKLFVPACGEFFLGLLKGEAGELVMTWPKGNSRFELGLGGEQDGLTLYSFD